MPRQQWVVAVETHAQVLADEARKERIAAAVAKRLLNATLARALSSWVECWTCWNAIRATVLWKMSLDNVMMRALPTYMYVSVACELTMYMQLSPSHRDTDSPTTHLLACMCKAKSAVMRWQKAQVAKGFGSWVLRVREMAELRRRMRGIIARMISRQVSAAFTRWQETAAQVVLCVCFKAASCTHQIVLRKCTLQVVSAQ